MTWKSAYLYVGFCSASKDSINVNSRNPVNLQIRTSDRTAPRRLSLKDNIRLGGEDDRVPGLGNVHDACSIAAIFNGFAQLSLGSWQEP